MVTRDGAIHIINGDSIRIINNQNEQPNKNNNEKSATIWLEGKDRPILNTVIEENNFGGGTNVDRSLYIDNADRTVIEKNNFVAVNVADVELTSKAKRTFLSSTNRVHSQTSNPRKDDFFSLKIIDDGDGTLGYPKNVLLTNLWDGNQRFIKKEDSTISHIGEINGGAMTENAFVLTLPKGFQPKLNEHIGVQTKNGFGLLRHAYNGQLAVV